LQNKNVLTIVHKNQLKVGVLSGRGFQKTGPECRRLTVCGVIWPGRCWWSNEAHQDESCWLENRCME